MRAVAFSKPGEFSLTDVPDPVPGPRDAIVRVEAVGICGTDLHVEAFRSGTGGRYRSDHRQENQWS